MVVKLDKVAFEDALDMTGFGKFNWLSFMLCSNIIVGMAFEIFSVAYLVPASACELLTTSSQQGLIAAVPLIGIIMTSHVWGYLADTRGRRKILIISMTIAYVCGSLAALSPSWIVLSLLKFCSSAAVSSATALSMTLMSECTPSKNRSLFILLTTSIFMVASGIMAVITIPILPMTFSYYIPALGIHFNSWRLLDLIFALPSLMGAIGVACSYESPKYLLSVGKNEKAMEVLRGIFSINSGKSDDLYRVNSVVLDEEGAAVVTGFWSSIKAQTLPMFKPPLLKDTLLLSALFIIVYICINTFVVWLPFMVNAFMISVDKGNIRVSLCDMIRFSSNSTVVDESEECTMNKYAMIIIFGINIIIAVLNTVTSSISKLVGRKYIFVCFQLLPSVTALTINLSRIWQLSGLGFMIYLTGIINFGSLSSYCVDVFPTNVKAMAICLTLMFGRGSAVLGINVMKLLLDSNCELAFYIFGGITLLGGILGLLLPSDKNIVERKEDLKKKFALL